MIEQTNQIKKHVVQVRIHKNRTSEQYKIWDDFKFNTKDDADEFIVEFYTCNDKNRHAVYMGQIG